MLPFVLYVDLPLLALLETVALGLTTPGVVTTAPKASVVAPTPATVIVPTTFEPTVIDITSPMVEDGTYSTPFALAPTWKTDPLPTS